MFRCHMQVCDIQQCIMTPGRGSTAWCLSKQQPKRSLTLLDPINHALGLVAGWTEHLDVHVCKQQQAVVRWLAVAQASLLCPSSLTQATCRHQLLAARASATSLASSRVRCSEALGRCFISPSRFFIWTLLKFCAMQRGLQSECCTTAGMEQQASFAADALTSSGNRPRR
jgi:hypothetical protein